LDAFIQDRYASWDGPLGKRILDGTATLGDLRDEAARIGEPDLPSGRQEMLEGVFNRFV